jgi:hypothetical protein
MARLRGFLFGLLPGGIAVLLLGLLAACLPQTGMQGSGHPNLIIVRQFTFSTGAVTLDPSFGFSLNRGEQGVPRTERAASVARSASFNLADTLAQQLAGLGYDVVHSETEMAEPGGRALIVTGVLRHINEGQRRRIGAENASVSVDVEIDQQNAGAAPQRITTFQLDSRTAPRVALIGVSTPRGANLSAAAARVGAAIAGTVAETARMNRWPAAPR